MNAALEPIAELCDHRLVAIQMIRQEHGALAQVLELVRRTLRAIDAGHSAPDFELLSLALYYIEEFPARMHHPKEDEYLFAAVRRHTHAFDEVLGRLGADHVEEERLIRKHYRLLVRCQAGAPGALQDLRAAFESYIAALYEHMRAEERLFDDPRLFSIPDAEWLVIAEAFRGHRDPLFGSERRIEFERLHRRITCLLPAKMHKGHEGGHEGAHERVEGQA